MKPRRYWRRDKKHTFGNIGRYGYAKNAILAGIYILLDKNKIVYIGQSVNFYSRLNAHNDKSWDKFRVIGCTDLEIRRRYEAKLINKYEPIYNKQIPYRGKSQAYVDQLEFRRWLTRTFA